MLVMCIDASVCRIHLESEKVSLTTSRYWLAWKRCGLNLSTKWTIRWKLTMTTRPTLSQWVRRVRQRYSHLCCISVKHHLLLATYVNNCRVSMVTISMQCVQQLRNRSLK